jgi:hypothetical protein
LIKRYLGERLVPLISKKDGGELKFAFALAQFPN